MYEAVSPFFQTALIFRGHPTYVFMKKGDVPFFRKRVRKLCEFLMMFSSE